MKLINFDRQFERYADLWIKENQSKFKTADQMEEAMIAVYLRWVNAPAEFLDGAAPGLYFHQFSDPDLLVNWAREYFAGNVPIPDQLLERITDMGEASVTPLMGLAFDGGASRVARITAFNLLIQIGSESPIDDCIALLLAADEPDELTEVASELLGAVGQAALPRLLSAIDSAESVAQEAFLDILCNFPGDPRIYTYTVDAFLRNADRRALYASYLGKLGDPRAIEPLTQALSSQEINYLDYIEIVNAIEALGGEVTEMREFSGDPFYESLKDTQ